VLPDDFRAISLGFGDFAAGEPREQMVRDSSLFFGQSRRRDGSQSLGFILNSHGGAMSNSCFLRR
jgi:hypothetical protein